MHKFSAFRLLSATAVAAALAGLALVVAPASAARAQTTLPVNWDFAAGALLTFNSPDTPPPGADNWSCRRRRIPTQSSW